MEKDPRNPPFFERVSHPIHPKQTNSQGPAKRINKPDKILVTKRRPLYRKEIYEMSELEALALTGGPSLRYEPPVRAS
jgi:hypothetical protein